MQWQISSDDYPADDGWTLTYYLVKSDNQIIIPSGDDGDGNHLVNVDAATTASYAPGLYSYFGIFSKDSEKHPLYAEERQIEIKPDFSAQTTGYDARSNARKWVDALEAVEHEAIAGKVVSISVGGRSSTYRTFEEWQDALDRAYRRLAREERRKGKRRPLLIKERLSRF